MRAAALKPPPDGPGLVLWTLPSVSAFCVHPAADPNAQCNGHRNHNADRYPNQHRHTNQHRRAHAGCYGNGTWRGHANADSDSDALRFKLRAHTYCDTNRSAGDPPGRVPLSLGNRSSGHYPL